jgi:hypothetical protein
MLKSQRLRDNGGTFSSRSKEIWTQRVKMIEALVEDLDAVGFKIQLDCCLGVEVMNIII